MRVYESAAASTKDVGAAAKKSRVLHRVLTHHSTGDVYASLLGSSLCEGDRIEDVEHQTFYCLKSSS